jgi:pyruvate dehydrogenase E2 component (dihydrolipoamide acetyltransferase)
MTDFLMPSLGADMEAGTVTEWLVKPGDTVQRGDIVAVVDTEKAEIEVEIWQSGVVERLVVAVGEQVPVGTILAELAEEGGASKSAAVDFEELEEEKPRAPAEVHGASKAVEARRAETPRIEPVTERLRASPLARRMARECMVELGEVEGTGIEGAITKADVERAIAARQGVASPEPSQPLRQVVPSTRPQPLPQVVPPTRPQPLPQVVPPTRSQPSDRRVSMRRAVAKAMARSKREIPHYYLERSIDLQAAQTWLAKENARRTVTERLLPAALFLKATALALAEVPELNGHFLDGTFCESDARHIGVAIAQRGGGLLAPAIHDVEQLDLDSVMKALRDLVNRVRRGKLRSSEVANATITVTSLGDAGVDKVYGVIFPPQVALVGFGSISERPWAQDGMVGARPVVSATLSADHRVSDGARGAKFLAALADSLATPERL